MKRINEEQNNELEKTAVFSDIMSRSERKKYKKMLKENSKEEKIENDIDINEIDKQFDDELKELKNQTKKQETKTEIKENKPSKKEQKIQEKMLKKKEKQETIENIFENKNSEENKQKDNNNKNTLSKTFATITFLLSIAYLLFSIFLCKDQINNLYLIINSSIIVTFTLFLMITIYTNSKKAKNILGTFTTLFLSTFICFNFLVISNTIEIPTQELLQDFKNQSITEALKWAKENNVEVKQIYEYSDNVAEYNIITQNIYPNTLLKKVNEITFTVSYGPNYDKIVSIPNMVGWEIDSALKTINENFLNNVNIEYEINNEIKKDVIISQSISGQIRRNDELNIKISLGSENELEPVEMINLQNQSLFEATLWLKRYGIKYEIIYIFSDSIQKDYVASQETEVGTTINPTTDTVTLIVSKGKKIIVPDLTKMTVDEATEWIMNNNLKVKFDTKYDSIIETGKIVETDYKENDEIEAGTLITIITSIGPLKMPKFNNLTEFRNWANTNGINYREEYEFNNDVANGDIIKTIPDADSVINYTDTLIVHVSYGKPITIPSFIGKHKNEIATTCSNLGLNCTFYYNGYSDTPANIAQNQNKNQGVQVVQGTYVSIGLSSGPKPAEQPKPVEPPKPACDSTVTRSLDIQKEWISGGSAQATINALSTKFAERYPNITFKFEQKEGNKPSGFIHEDSPITNRSQVQDCKTYTIIINK